MKAPLKTLVVTLISGLILMQLGPAFCQKNNNAKPFSWNFTDTDLIKIIEAVAQYTGKNFDVDPAIKGKATIIMNEDIAPELAYQILESILSTRGYMLVPAVDGNLIKVVPSADAAGSPVPTGVVGAERIAPYENVVTQIVPVKYGQASDLASVLDTLKSKDSRIQAYVPANVLIITEKGSQLKRLLNILETIDVAGFEEGFEIIPLKYQSAELLAMEIMDVLSEEAEALAAGQRRTAATMPPSARMAARTIRTSAPVAAEIVGAARTPLRIIPDTWTNSLIVVAVESMMVKVKRLIEHLDVETPFEEGNLHSYSVKNADVEEIESALSSLISAAGAGGARRTQQAPGQPPAAASTIEAFEKEVRISVYKPTNTLLVVASPRDWKLLETLLEQLDVPERQVYVEAVIMEVLISDDTTVGVDMAAIGEDDFIAASTFGNLANAIIGGPLAFTGATGGYAGVLDGTMEITVPTFDPTTGMITGSTTQTVNKVPVLLTAIQTVTDVDILSAPALLTTDNEQSRIHVGQEVPVTTGSIQSLSQQAITPSVYSQVAREPVGVTLTVEPQISEGDYVKLKVTVEVSDTIESDIGIDPNTAGPTFRVAEIENTIVIRDGYTAIIGGLMIVKSEDSRSQVPILGDIPILGFFFRQRGQVESKRNLVVLLTPHIVKSGEELDELTARHLDEYELKKLEMRRDLDFWRKVFKKEERSKE